MGQYAYVIGASRQCSLGEILEYSWAWRGSSTDSEHMLEIYPLDGFES